MSRELDRRISALESTKRGEGIEYVVVDYPPEDDEPDNPRLRQPMTEAEWLANHCTED